MSDFAFGSTHAALTLFDDTIIVGDHSSGDIFVHHYSSNFRLKVLSPRQHVFPPNVAGANEHIRVLFEEASPSELGNIPTVFSQVVASWPACEKWSLSFFKKKYGEATVAVIPDKKYSASIDMTLSAYIDNFEKYKEDFVLHQTRPPYLRGWRFEV